jgi:hypothetical protein
VYELNGGVGDEHWLAFCSDDRGRRDMASAWKGSRCIISR